MKIILGQGNPEDQYKGTRHNLGFLIIDDLHDIIGGDNWKKSSKTSALTSEALVDGQKILLVKPLTYYNETGRVARALVDFYKLNPQEDFLVIHDDLALPFGTVRTRVNGSDAGNNGIKSLNQHLGADYARIRVGIWNDLRDRIDDSDFVLSKFSKQENSELSAITRFKILPQVKDFLLGKLEPTSQR